MLQFSADQEKAKGMQMLRVEYVTEDNNGGVYTGIISLKSKDKSIIFETLKHIHGLVPCSIQTSKKN